MSSELAPVYLDDTRVRLQGDPSPKVEKVLAAAGKRGCRVRRVDAEEPLRADEVLDRVGGGEIRLVVLDPVPVGEPALPSDGTAFAADESSGVGAVGDPQQFGAARPGMAGTGAQGSLQRGEEPTTPASPLGTQAKSDFAQDGAAAQAFRQDAARTGDANRTYGVGDLAPGGRTSMDGGRNVGVPDTPRAGRGADRGHLDGTQEFQSGGRQGEGGAPPYSDEGVGSSDRRQAGLGTASGVDAPETQAQGGVARELPGTGAGGIPEGGLRDQSTDHAGRQQGQPAMEGTGSRSKRAAAPSPGETRPARPAPREDDGQA